MPLLGWTKKDNVRSLPIMTKELGAHAWGNGGSYLAANQMRAFIEEVGHEYESLLDNADETRDEED
jgi:hypothetical protein